MATRGDLMNHILIAEDEAPIANLLQTALTGVGFEPWHYRYVGRDAAKEITEQGLCLEEYLAAA